jgi:V/A-type H+-transporting ATPase subunit E
MSIENILERIREEAGSAAGELVARAEEEAERIRGSYEAEGADLKVKLEQRAEKKAVEEKRRLIVNEQLELRKQLLRKKREILDELYERAKGEMERLGEEDYLDLMKEMILRGAISGNEEIVVAKQQRNLYGDDFLDALNRENKLGKGFKLAKDSGDFPWGVILREGARIVDLTLGVLVEQLRERIESEIAPMLFSDS